MVSTTINIFITTRNRPSSVISCLISLNGALSDCFLGKVDCYIIDDSTEETFSEELLYQLRYLNLPYLSLVHLDNIFSRKILSILSTSPYKDFATKTIRELGTGYWDHAGSRNFASLIAFAMSSSKTLSIFIDDDILFSGTTYHDMNFTVPGCEILQNLADAVSFVDISVSGTRVIGRADTSVFEHFLYVLLEIEEIEGKVQKQDSSPELLDTKIDEFLRFPKTLPIRLISSNDVLGAHSPPFGPGELSGGAIATNMITVKSIPYFNIYNEDWIWFILLGSEKNVIKNVNRNLLHAPPHSSDIDLGFVKYQEYGEVFYEILESIFEDIPDHENRIVWCLNEITKESFATTFRKVLDDRLSKYSDCFRFLGKLEYIISDKASSKSSRLELTDLTRLGAARSFLKDLEAYTASITSQEIADDIQSHFRSSFLWGDMLTHTKDKIAKEVLAVMGE